MRIFYGRITFYHTIVFKFLWKFYWKGHITVVIRYITMKFFAGITNHGTVISSVIVVVILNIFSEWFVWRFRKLIYLYLGIVFYAWLFWQRFRTICVWYNCNFIFIQFSVWFLTGFQKNQIIKNEKICLCYNFSCNGISLCIIDFIRLFFYVSKYNRYGAVTLIAP